MRADHFSADVQEFLRILESHLVRYVVVGGIAVIYHGYARLTGDVDFFYDRARDNVENLWEALLEFWSGSVPGIDAPNELEEPDLVLQFGRPPNRIDLLSSISGVSFSEAWEHRITETIVPPSGEAVSVSILGLGDLRKAKAEAGRPKDVDDLEHLPETR